MSIYLGNDEIFRHLNPTKNTLRLIVSTIDHVIKKSDVGVQAHSGKNSESVSSRYAGGILKSIMRPPMGARAIIGGALCPCYDSLNVILNSIYPGVR